MGSSSSSSNAKRVTNTATGYVRGGDLDEGARQLLIGGTQGDVRIRLESLSDDVAMSAIEGAVKAAGNALDANEDVTKRAFDFGGMSLQEAMAIAGLAIEENAETLEKALNYSQDNNESAYDA